jgi:hypothetical protein
MARPTIHDRLVAALQRRGETIVADARSAKYTVLTRKVGDGWFYYVGPAGALRVGRTVADSRPVGAGFRARLLGMTIE